MKKILFALIFSIPFFGMAQDVDFDKKTDEVIVKQALGEDYKLYQKMKSLRSNMDKVNMLMPFELEIK